jgi:hypothetical protein
VIEIHRGPEPAALAAVRAAELPRVRRIAGRRPPLSEEITGYGVARDDLWRAQHYKCAYCEHREQQQRNDAEHYRPKAEADRRPGSTATHGYWWLAWTWENLLFACRNCNQPRAKGVQFPLARGSHPLRDPQTPPGRERPLLLDPAAENGVRFIEFKLVTRPGTTAQDWRPVARGGDLRGDTTIRVCLLDRPGLLDLYTSHVNANVWPRAEEVQEALRAGKREAVLAAWARARTLLFPAQPFVGLSFDALRHFVPDARLTPWGLRWKLFKARAGDS